MLKHGLQRFAATPGLQELQGRKVLYFEYRRDADEKWAFITGTDIVRAGSLEIRVYSSALPLSQREPALADLRHIVSKHGAELRINPDYTGR